jgi:hypothetical protein
MRFYNTSFFCDKDKGPRAHVEIDNDNTWPATLVINTSVSERCFTPKVTFFISSVEDLLRFKYSLASSIEEAMNKLTKKEDLCSICGGDDRSCKCIFVDGASV